MSINAYVLRISPNGVDRFPEALENDQLIIGWSEAYGLLEPELTWTQFRRIIYQTCHSGDSDMRGAGRSSGHMWRFIRDMKTDDLIVVPYGSEFYVAKVCGPAFHDKSKVDDDSAYRRQVEWLNKKQGIPRSMAKSALISRMKTRGTCANAGDLVEEIQECVDRVEAGERPSFDQDLQLRLVEEALDELRSGRMESYGFERLIRTMLIGFGAVNTRIVPRSEDKGIDIVATFRIAGTIRVVIGIQAKHYQPEPPVGANVIGELIHGIEEGGEDVTHGMVVTSGTFGDKAIEKAELYMEEKGIPIELIDGDQFAKLIVEHGLEVVRDISKRGEF